MGESLVSDHDTPAGRPRRLDQFKELNPHLIRGQGSDRCLNLWDLLTPRHREDADCCLRGETGLDLSSCFLGGSERWKDSSSSLPVVVAHPLCGHTEDDVSHHELFGDFFTARGLDYLVSRSSWHGDSHSLVVIARPDVIDGIEMPSEDMSPVYATWPVPDWEMQEALKLAEEDVLRNRRARQARNEEDGGDLAMALRLYCDTAYADRTGGFHHLAREQLGHAKRLVGDHPDLDLGYLLFKNDRDRDYVCGEVPPVLSRAELVRRLHKVELPRGWGRFRSPKGGSAVARISYGERIGTVWLVQGGILNLWSSSVEMEGGAMIRTSLSDEPQSSDAPSYCWPDPESALDAAVKGWRDLWDSQA